MSPNVIRKRENLSQTHYRTLDLSHNGVTRVPGGSFGQLSRLSRLVLSSNGLGLLADSALDGLADLESLDLANNQLVALPPDVFRLAVGIT